MKVPMCPACRLSAARPRCVRMRLLTAYEERCRQVSGYSPVFLAAVVERQTAWSREARLVIMLAAQLGIVLNEERLKVSDVHDLQALQNVLAECARREAGRGATA